MESKGDVFWGDSNLDILFRADRLTEFFPLHDHTRAEKLNALMRFAIVSGVLVSMYTSDPKWALQFVAGGIALTLFVHSNYSRTATPPPLEGFEVAQRAVDPVTGQECQLPTPNNPFMNVTLNDYRTDPDRPPACSPDLVINENGDTVADESELQFSRNLFVDVGDLYGTVNSRREFYTTAATTIPHDKQNEFAQWLYGDAPSCKDNKAACVPYERLQQKRFYFPDETVNPVTSK